MALIEMATVLAASSGDLLAQLLMSAQRIRRGVLALLVTLGCSVLLVEQSAAALTADGARRRLIAAHVFPRPLFPTGFPRGLAGADATFHRSGRYFSIEYTTCCGAQDALTAIVGFERAPARSISQVLGLQRSQRHRVRRVNLRGRRMYFYNGDISFGYIAPDTVLGPLADCQCGALPRRCPPPREPCCHRAPRADG
jgi:hypothetical protein